MQCLAARVDAEAPPPGSDFPRFNRDISAHFTAFRLQAIGLSKPSDGRRLTRLQTAPRLLAMALSAGLRVCQRGTDQKTILWISFPLNGQISSYLMVLKNVSTMALS
ncbi:MAG: hypothetical protein ACI9ZH_000717 [Paracoccaceae bacterium]|jgi:hypothetical protein